MPPRSPDLCREGQGFNEIDGKHQVKVDANSAQSFAADEAASFSAGIVGHA
jgi:hypothetical protein